MTAPTKILSKKSASELLIEASSSKNSRKPKLLSLKVDTVIFGVDRIHLEVYWARFLILLRSEAIELFLLRCLPQSIHHFIQIVSSKHLVDTMPRLGDAVIRNTILREIVRSNAL